MPINNFIETADVMALGVVNQNGLLGLGNWWMTKQNNSLCMDSLTLIQTDLGLLKEWPSEYPILLRSHHAMTWYSAL